MDLQDGDRVAIRTENGTLEVTLCAVDNMAQGVIVLPRHRELNWRIFDTGKIQLQEDQIRKLK